MEQIEFKAPKPVRYLKREQILLTKELKERVEKKILETLKRVKALYQVDIPMPTIHYDLKRLVAGQARHWKNPQDPYGVPIKTVLRFHPVFLVENTEDYIRETVPHEVAHIAVAYVWKGKPKNPKNKKVISHGEEWREMMVKLGVGPKGEQSWTDIIKSFYNPSSLDIPPKKKYGPRKVGGKQVGDIMARIKRLTPEEIAALLARLGIEGVSKNSPEVQAEIDELDMHLTNTREYRPLRKGTLSVAGHALNAIKSLEN